MWIKGTIDGYSFYFKQYDEGSEYGISNGRISKLEIWKDGQLFVFYFKQYDEGSEYGISNGRISKLEIWKDGQLFVQYDRGWSKKPSGAQVKAVYEQILKEYN